MKHILSSIVLCGLVLLGCKEKSSETSTASVDIAPSEKLLCDSLGFDLATAKEIKAHAKSPLSRLNYSLGQAFGGNGEPIPADNASKEGLMVHASNDRSEALVDELSESLRAKGYTIFLVDNNFGIDGKDDDVAVVEDTSLLSVLKLIGTDGANYDIDNDSVIAIVRSLSSRYGFRLLGASGDWLSLRLKGPVADWNALATEVEKIAPDVVSQGTGTVEELAKELEKSKQIYFWWD